MAESSGDIRPLQIGVRMKPPAIVLLYQQHNKYRKRVMPVREFKKNSSVTLTACDLKVHHSLYLADVPNFKVEKMLRLLQNDLRGLDLDRSLREIDQEFALAPDEDLNGTDDVTLRRKKEIMDLSFEKNRKKPGDPDFRYDVEVDFSQTAGIESSIWDSEKEDEF